jgi:hypothetical protein
MSCNSVVRRNGQTGVRGFTSLNLCVVGGRRHFGGQESVVNLAGRLPDGRTLGRTVRPVDPIPQVAYFVCLQSDQSPAIPAVASKLRAGIALY